MALEGSITRWIRGIKNADEKAAGELWRRYSRRLITLARAKLRRSRPRLADEEDIALVAFNSLCQGAEAGRFPNLTDRDDLWRLLVRVTAHKVCDQIKFENREKRGGGRVLDEGALDGDGEGRALERVIGKEPSPELAAAVVEEFENVLRLLEREPLQRVARAKMEGFTNEEIASSLDCSVRTVARKVTIIRSLLRARGCK